MPVNAIQVGNFKGLREQQTVRLKPLTLFIGPNSSGKSSCIHALAALAQTVKLAGDPRPLVLDDEFAQVHLGRFIEVIHSKSYGDSISLGISIGKGDYWQYDDKLTPSPFEAAGAALYSFKSTKTTQDTYLDEAHLSLGELEYHVRKVGKTYEITERKSGQKIRAERESGVSLEWRFSTAIANRAQTVRAFTPLTQLQRALTVELRRVLYLGPFRQAPLRRYPTRGATPTEVGSQGEATITLLANETVQSRSRAHIKQIARWLKECGLAKDIDVARVASSDLFDVSITLQDNASLPIADLGYGLSQVLPVLTQCSFAPEGSTLLFEQPELHLHQLAARPLAKVFIETIREKNAHVVLETHSPDMFMQIVRELRAGTISLGDVAAYRVAREGGRTVLTSIDIDPETFDVYEAWECGLSVDAERAR